MRARVLVVSMMLLALTACAGLPTSGPVRQGEDRPYAAAAEPAVRRLAPPPRAGAGPEEIVRGFLLASAGTGDDIVTARRYLTATAVATWRPESGVAILSATPELRVESTRVRMSGTQVGSLDADSAYRVLSPGKAITADFVLRQEARDEGQWRISELPDGLYLPRLEVDRVFRSVNAYYLDARQATIVPEAIVLPAADDLAARLTRRLLRGPGPALSPVTTSALPVGSALEGDGVPVRSGIAEVALSAPSVPPNLNREALLAQFAFTLRQVPGVTGIRLSLNDSVVETSGVGVPQPVTAWSRYDPADSLPVDPTIYAAVSGRLGSVSDGAFTPLAGGPGNRRADAKFPAVSRDETLLAAVTTDGAGLRYGRLGQAEVPTVRLRGESFGKPSFDDSGNLWVLDVGTTRGAGPVLWELGSGDRTVAVTLPSLGGVVRLARVSADGLHIALVYRREGRDRLYTGSLFPAALGRTQIAQVRQIAPAVRSVRDLAWQDARTLAVLSAESGSVVQPHVLSIDGFASETISPVPANALTITAAGSAPLLVGAEGGRVFQASGRTWRELARAGDPAYPG